MAPTSCRRFSRRFSAAHPQATVTVQENTTNVLLKSCEQGEIDLAIVAAPHLSKTSGDRRTLSGRTAARFAPQSSPGP
ncbi:MAG: LysR substrate-binding domain-containing protein [Planctomycetaceae bacterium]